MKIETNEKHIAINQIAVQAMFGGLLFAFALVSCIFFMIGFADWTIGEGEGPLSEFLITALLGVMAVGRLNSSERYSDSIRKLLKESS